MQAARLLVVLAGAALLAGAGCSDSTGPESTPGPDPLELDTGNLPPLPEFPDNPTTVQGVALGRRLFHETALSGDGTQSCASCHRQTSAFADPDRFSVGIDGTLGTRNAPLIVNPGWQESFFWDGRVPSLEEQAKVPVADPGEMAADWDDVVAALAALPAYPPLFEAAFGSPDVTQERVVQAIAQFERTFVSTESRYDLWLRGELQLTDAEKRGHDLFFSESGECFHCHGSLNLFTDDDFHDIGLDVDPPDHGLGGANGNVFDRGKFKTPTLRNVEVTAPYMHDGRFDTLEQVLDFYAEGIQRSPNLDPVLGVHLNGGGSGLPLAPQDRADIVAFLKALTDPAFLANPDLGPPSP
jgi:cytochrome c peroxidase